MWLPPPENNAQTGDEPATQPEDQTVTSDATSNTNEPPAADASSDNAPQEQDKVLRFKRKWTIGLVLIVGLAALALPIMLIIAFVLVGAMSTSEEIHQARQTTHQSNQQTPAQQKANEPFDAIRQMYTALHAGDRQSFLSCIAKDPDNQRFGRVQYAFVRSHVDLRTAITREYSAAAFEIIQIKQLKTHEWVYESPAQLKKRLDILDQCKNVSIDNANQATITFPGAGDVKPVVLLKQNDHWAIDMLAVTGLQGNAERSKAMEQMVIAARAMADTIPEVGADGVGPDDVWRNLSQRIMNNLAETVAFAEGYDDPMTARTAWIDQHTGGPASTPQSTTHVVVVGKNRSNNTSANSAKRSSSHAADTTAGRQPTAYKKSKHASTRIREDFITGLDRWQRLRAEGDPGEQIISVTHQQETVIPPGPFEERRDVLNAAIDAQQYLPVIKYLRQQRVISQPLMGWWQEKFAAGHVPLQMEMAVLLSKQKPQKAAMCAVTAYIGAVMDAKLCDDASVSAAPKGLLLVYPQVQEILKQHAHMKAQLNAAAVRWHQSHPNRPSPQWIGYHGIGALSKGQVELLPRDQWLNARARALAKFQPDQPQASENNTSEPTPHSQSLR